MGARTQQIDQAFEDNKLCKMYLAETRFSDLNGASKGPKTQAHAGCNVELLLLQNRLLNCVHPHVILRKLPPRFGKLLVFLGDDLECHAFEDRFGAGLRVACIVSETQESCIWISVVVGIAMVAVGGYFIGASVVLLLLLLVLVGSHGQLLLALCEKGHSW